MKYADLLAYDPREHGRHVHMGCLEHGHLSALCSARRTTSACEQPSEAATSLRRAALAAVSLTSSRAVRAAILPPGARGHPRKEVPSTWTRRGVSAAPRVWPTACGAPSPLPLLSAVPPIPAVVQTGWATCWGWDWNLAVP